MDSRLNHCRFLLHCNVISHKIRISLNSRGERRIATSQARTAAHHSAKKLSDFFTHNKASGRRLKHTRQQALDSLEVLQIIRIWNIFC